MTAGPTDTSIRFSGKDQSGFPSASQLLSQRDALSTHAEVQPEFPSAKSILARRDALKAEGVARENRVREQVSAGHGKQPGLSAREVGFNMRPQARSTKLLIMLDEAADEVTLEVWK